MKASQLENHLSLLEMHQRKNHFSRKEVIAWHNSWMKNLKERTKDITEFKRVKLTQLVESVSLSVTIPKKYFIMIYANY